MKTKTQFVCQECGFNSPKWVGRCPECNSWNSLTEEMQAAGSSPRHFSLGQTSQPERLAAVATSPGLRLLTGMAELDQVLGGGIVEGSVVLIGGSPGIGKSTLLLQVCTALSRQGKKVLYISAEESVQQAKLRADRLGGVGPELYILSETNLGVLLEHIERLAPEIIIADSIQVLCCDDISSAAGSVSQVRECASRLTMLAKRTGRAVFLVGHVTKEGSLAGPRVLEHLVDTVLYFEGETHTNFRILRAVKNRFGSTNEIGIFEMTTQGLRTVENPSQLFLSERPQHISGSVVVATMEGTRPLLVEIQALVSQTSFGMPRRRSMGIDFNRTSLLTAVLEKRCQMALQMQDIFVNVAGGVSIVEPAADLAVVTAIASGFRELPVAAEDVVFGEVGLGGEVRAVSQVALRIREIQQLGFKRVIMPLANVTQMREHGMPKNLHVEGVTTVRQALDCVLSG